MSEQPGRTAIVALGELVVDWICMEKGAGPLHTGSFWRCLGGNAANVAVGLRRLGSEAALVAKVGDDIHEKYLRCCLAAEGVDLTHLIVDRRYPTAQCYAFWDRDDDYSYFNWPEPHAADMLCADELRIEMFQGACVMHTTGISLMIEPRRSAVLRAIEMAHEQGVLFSFDATFATDRGDQSDADQLAMHSADILKLNFYELAYWIASLTDRRLNSCNIEGCTADTVKEELADASRLLFREFNPALLAVTLGEYGCLLATESCLRFCPALKVETVAAVGAGDGFIAGLLHVLTERHTPLTKDQLQRLTAEQLLEMGMFANAVGALVTTTAGASDGLPYATAVEALLESSSAL